MGWKIDKIERLADSRYRVSGDFGPERGTEYDFDVSPSGPILVVRRPPELRSQDVTVGDSERAVLDAVAAFHRASGGP